MPDLRRKFIRGAKNPLDRKQLSVGGEDTIALKHLHQWAEFIGKKWYAFNKNGVRHRVDNWDNGIGDKGEGHYPLFMDNERKLYTTNQWGNVEVDNRPKYVELRFIINIY